MRIIPLILLTLLFSCKSESSVDLEKEQHEEIQKKGEVKSEGANVENQTSLENVELECFLLGYDDYDIPNSEVYLVIDKKREKIAECLTCDKIAPEDYKMFDVPENALSACGGWFAGGGDYFYVIEGADKGVEVYFGWQDEGQMMDDDTTFHWKLSVERNL